MQFLTQPVLKKSIFNSSSVRTTVCPYLIAQKQAYSILVTALYLESLDTGYLFPLSNKEEGKKREKVNLYN